MLTNEEVRKILGKEFSKLTDSEIEEMKQQMLNFCMMISEN